jgi:hypothetical protein
MCGMFDQVALRAGSVSWPCAPGLSALGAPAGFKQVNLGFSKCSTLFGRDYTWVGPRWVEVGQVAQAR